VNGREEVDGGSPSRTEMSLEQRHSRLLIAFGTHGITRVVKQEQQPREKPST
jgi:hypothetical protein